jgi:hypothetical protein
MLSAHASIVAQSRKSPSGSHLATIRSANPSLARSALARSQAPKKTRCSRALIARTS